MTDKILRFLKSVDYLPQSKRGRDSFYDEIIREFLFSEAKYAEVKDTGKKILALQVGLKNRVKQRRECIKVLTINKKVYLERLDPTELKKMQIKSNDRTSQLSLQKPSIEVVKVLNNTIVKVRCPNCKTLNAKDERTCMDCGRVLHQTEEQYQASMKEWTSLERTLNSGAE
jgi:phage FluMu protein Com